MPVTDGEWRALAATAVEVEGGLEASRAWRPKGALAVAMSTAGDNGSLKSGAMLALSEEVEALWLPPVVAAAAEVDLKRAWPSTAC